jgi:acetyltransferase-like isoleucine patch superfamily enzyme
MKFYFKFILFHLIAFFSKLYSIKTAKYFSSLFNYFYTIWLITAFKKVGYNVTFASPLSLHGGKYVTIGDNFGCDQRFRLDAYDEFLGDKFNPEIIIGNNVSIQKDCHLAAINKIVLGDNVLLASKVYISDHSHGEINLEAIKSAPCQRKLFSKGPVIIKDNVWIGEGVSVLPNVTIGENSIVGANSVVTKSFPKNSVIAGNPAKLIRVINL